MESSNTEVLAATDTGHVCEYTAYGAEPTLDNPACGAPATICNPHGLSGSGARHFDYDEWYCAPHADPAWITTGQADVLAAYFAGVLRGWLNDSEWAEMRALNATPEFAGYSFCASHNYCDANMAMDAAWVAIVGRHTVASSEADSDLWTRAWDIAKLTYLTGPTTHACEWCTLS